MTPFPLRDPIPPASQNVQEAVLAYYFDQPAQAPKRIRLHLVRDELLAGA